MSNLFRRTNVPVLPNSDLDEDCVPVERMPIQEQQVNAPSQQYITLHNTNVGDNQSYVSRNPPAISGRGPGISIYKERNQDIAPEPRNLYVPFRKESERLKTFHDWPSNAVIDKETLARNGFIYVHMLDRVQCIFCRGVLSDWQAGDIVENEHKEHCPECPFAFKYECGNIPISNMATLESRNVVCPQPATHNVQSYAPLPTPSIHTNTVVVPSSQPQRHVISSIIPRAVNPPPVASPYYNTTVNIPVAMQGVARQSSASIVLPNSPDTMNNNIRGETMSMPLAAGGGDTSNTADSKSHNPCYDEPGSMMPSIPNGQFSVAQGPQEAIVKAPKYIQWANEKTRIRSFRGWPAQMTQTPRALAEAGLLYMGNGDRCKCYWCGGELYDWEPEDIPWEEHAKWFPQCGYVHTVKGTEYIQYVRNKQNGLVLDTSTQELMKRPHVLAVLATGEYTEEQVEEVFNRFGADTLIDAPSIVRAIEQTRAEREAARANTTFTPIHDNDTEMKERPSVFSKSATTMMNESTGGSRPGSSCSVGSLKDVETVFKENEMLKDQKMCKICMDNDVCMMFLPCKHLATCEDCAYVVQECPVCRQALVDRVKVFWA